MIHARTLNALEFQRIADNLAALCLSGVGRERAQAVAPLEDAEAVTLATRIYEEAADWASRPAIGGAIFCVSAFPDVSGLLRARRSAAPIPFSLMWMPFGHCAKCCALPKRPTPP